MVKIFKNHWPLILSVVVLWAGTVVCLLQSLERTEGNLVYALDDTYIHMAMAKNISRYGVWGITKHGFSFTSSSILWPSLLSSLYFGFGVNDITPFVLNVFFATAACVAAYVILSRHLGPKLLLLAALLLFVFLVPLIPLTLLGMEHVLHAFLALTFAYISARALARSEPTARQLVSITVLSAFLTLTRYEGIFLVLTVAGLFLLRKKVRAALLVTAAGAIPILVFGMVAMAKGWYFVPNSVLLKTEHVSVFPFRIHTFLRLPFVGNLFREPHLLMLTLASLMAFALAVQKSKDVWREATVMPAIFVVATLLHLQYASTGFFYRYEAYLVALGIVTVAAAFGDLLPNRSRSAYGNHAGAFAVSIALILFLTGWPLARRARDAHLDTPYATMNIFQQQYQMGLFLREYFQGETVAASDIGAINYLADIKCLDLAGLGSMEVARAKKHGEYNTEVIAALAETEGARIAILYPKCYEAYGGLPLEWPFIGIWKIPDNYVCGSDELSFYALTAEEQFLLFHSLVGFSKKLPSAVEEIGPIVGPASRRAAATR